MKNKKNNSLIIYLAFLLVILLMPFLFFRGAETRPLKYYQVVDYFRQDKVLGFDLKFSNGELTLLVEESKAQTIPFKSVLPSEEMFLENPTLALRQFVGLMQTIRSDRVADLSREPNDMIRVDLVEKPAVRRVITYKLANIGCFLQDIDGFVKQHNAMNPDNLIQSDYLRGVNPFFAFVGLMVNTIIPLCLLALSVYFYYKYMGGGSLGQSLGTARSKHGKYLDKGPKILMRDVAALHEEKEEVQDLIMFLKDPNKFGELGARIPAGVLFVGPPGTGKTLLAKALAGEAGVPFFFVSGSAFVEMFVGVGAARVREVFDHAKKHSPCIVFIDEIDAVGKERSGYGGGHDERDQTLNQLLVEMDGFKANSGVIVVAATNMGDKLDKALLRPGRFDRVVYIGSPDVKGREEILKVHSRNKPLAPDVRLEEIAKATIGFSGADLANLMNESALRAAKQGKKAIRARDIDHAVIRVVVGTEKNSKKVTPRNKESTAWHESGHALCSYFTSAADAVRFVSIIPTGAAGGFTLTNPREDDMYKTKDAMFAEIVVAMGGRVAEKLKLGELSTGAISDMRNATRIAMGMVTVFGFTDELGTLVYDAATLGKQYIEHSEEVKRTIDEQVRKIAEAAWAEAERILTEHDDKLEELAEYLIENEKIEGEKFKQMMEGAKSVTVGSITADPEGSDPQ
ncbi:MAG: ATP-dependent zinc metalloprotease FtsH [Oscillospiraceae bacterium]|nr:ATP-dependent zinc metalloprotease FtsH [Oscillospiraceae bacterium]